MRELNEHDVEMFVTLNNLKHLSRCIDKQVVCIITDEDYNVLSVGINTIEACDQNCDDKEHRLCVVRHAEVVAVDNLSNLNRQRAARAYVSLFPCAPCQDVLSPLVDEIVTFGMAHKKWTSDKVVVFPHLTYKLIEAGIGKTETYPNDDSAQALDREVTGDILTVSAHSADHKLFQRVREARLPLYRNLLVQTGSRTTCKTLYDRTL